MLISIFNDSDNFKKSDSNSSLWINIYEAVVYSLKSLIGSLQGLTLIIPQIRSF